MRRWRQCLARVEPLTSLILSLEQRLEEGRQQDRLEDRLREAEQLGLHQAGEVAVAEELVGRWCGVMARLTFRWFTGTSRHRIYPYNVVICPRHQVQQRRRLVAQLRLLERQLRGIQVGRQRSYMDRKLIFRLHYLNSLSVHLVSLQDRRKIVHLCKDI